MKPLCNLATNGFIPATYDLLGAGGEKLIALDGNDMGSPREGILLTPGGEFDCLLGEAGVVLSEDLKLPQEVTTYAPNPRGGPPAVDTVRA